MNGRIHSFQSLGAVDGPGIRYVVFMQGCPLRCVYCHNPDTWDPRGGGEYPAEDVVRRALRCRAYFGDKGGVTVTGGEPVLQPDFVAELFERLHGEGVHTALDTSGAVHPERAEKVLRHTDLALVDVKFLDAGSYRRFCGGDFETVTRFLALAERLGVPVWIRHVVVPALTDHPQQIKALGKFAARFANVQKIELLPFQTLCLEKYQAMGIPFPLAGTPAMDETQLDVLRQLLVQ